MTELDILRGLDERFLATAVEDDPVVWAKNVLSVDLWSKQREILRLLERVDRVAVPSTHGVGKTKVAAVATARFLAKYPPGTARVVTTAPSEAQVKAALWNEIGQLYADSNGALPGRVNQKEWWIGNYMAAFGRKPSEYAAGTFQGIHAKHILVILDEADAIPTELWNGVEKLVTNPGSKVLAIGNPYDPQSVFARVLNGARVPGDDGRPNNWHVVHISAFDAPSFTGESVPDTLVESLISREFVEQRRREWGEDSALWKGGILATHPDESDMVVVRAADVLAARRTPDDAPTRRVRFEDVQLGVDIAASNTGDETIIRERRGNVVGRRWAVRSGEPEDVSDLIVHAQAESGASIIHMDTTGVGFGFMSDIRRRIPTVAVLPFIAAASAEDTKQFVNRRAEAHWYMRERLRHRTIDFSEMEHADPTIAQLTSVRYDLIKGKIRIELKEEVRKRIGRSPDDSDALLLAVLPPSGAGMPAPATVRAATKDRSYARSLPAQSSDETSINQGPRAVMPREVPASPHGLRTKRRSLTLRALPSSRNV